MSGTGHGGVTETELDAWLAFALGCCDEADAVALQHFHRDMVIETKPDRSFVTEVDRAIERRIRERIGSEYPGHGVVGEEFGTDSGQGSVRWYVDPIDGTHNFMRGVPLFGTLLAVEADGELLAGVMSAPALGGRWFARRGGGAWAIGAMGPDAGKRRRIGVSRVAELVDTHLLYGSAREIAESGEAPGFSSLIADVWRDRGFGDFWGYALVAEGAAEAMVEVGPRSRRRAIDPLGDRPGDQRSAPRRRPGAASRGRLIRIGDGVVNVRAALIGLLGLALTGGLSACQSASVSPATSLESAPSAPPSSIPGGSASAVPSTPDAGPTIDPDWVTRPALTCGDSKRLFPPEALAGPGLAELGLDAAAAVLRSTIADTPDYFPDFGWHRVVDTSDGVTFVAVGNPETPWFEVTVGLFDGTLQAIGQGQCTLAIAAPHGVTWAEWWLDPDGPPITPNTTELSILLREQACASGKPPEGRVLPPTIVIREDAIDVAVGIRITPGGADCPSNPAYSMKVVLPEPLGARVLLDASEFPPRPVTTEDPG